MRLGPLTSWPVTPPVTGAMRDVMFQLADVVAEQDGDGEYENDQVWPAARVRAGAMVTAPPGAVVPAGDVVMPHPDAGAGMVTERRATDVVPNSDGTLIVQVTSRVWRRTIVVGDAGEHVIVTRLKSAPTSRASIVVEPYSQLDPGLHIWSDTREETAAPDMPPVDGARSETVNEVEFAGARKVVWVETQFVEVVPNASWSCHPDVAPVTGLVRAPNVKSAGWLPKRLNEHVAL